MTKDKSLNLIITITYAKGKILSSSLTSTSTGGLQWQFDAKIKDYPLESSVEAWLLAYSQGRSTVPASLPFAWDYLPLFTQKALKVVADIPWGHVLTYKEVAVLLGNPKAARPVGGACGRNLFPLFIPCHRVIDTQRKMRGYSAGDGVSLKECLLSHEGVSL